MEKNCNLIFRKQKDCCYINITSMFCLRKKESMVKSSHVDIHVDIVGGGFVCVSGGRSKLSSQRRMDYNLENSQLRRIKVLPSLNITMLKT